jgi:hypothetical protein
MPSDIYRQSGQIPRLCGFIINSYCRPKTSDGAVFCAETRAVQQMIVTRGAIETIFNLAALFGLIRPFSA